MRFVTAFFNGIISCGNIWLLKLLLSVRLANALVEVTRGRVHCTWVTHTYAHARHAHLSRRQHLGTNWLRRAVVTDRDGRDWLSRRRRRERWSKHQRRAHQTHQRKERVVELKNRSTYSILFATQAAISSTYFSGLYLKMRWNYEKKSIMVSSSLPEHVCLAPGCL